MGIDFSNSMVPRQTVASLTHTNPDAKHQEAMGEMSNGMMQTLSSPGVMCDPSGRFNHRTGRYDDNNGTIIEAMFLPKQGGAPEGAVKGGEEGTVGAAKIEASGQRPPTLSDNLGRNAYSVT